MRNDSFFFFQFQSRHSRVQNLDRRFAAKPKPMTATDETPAHRRFFDDKHATNCASNQKFFEHLSLDREGLICQVHLRSMANNTENLHERRQSARGKSLSEPVRLLRPSAESACPRPPPMRFARRLARGSATVRDTRDLDDDLSQ